MTFDQVESYDSIVRKTNYIMLQLTILWRTRYIILYFPICDYFLPSELPPLPLLWTHNRYYVNKFNA